jgi:2-C-methyl-D-erythritol 4-phosphate cytidylyltransferase
VIVAAGAGVRYGDAAKALTQLGGRPMVEHSLLLFASDPSVDQIVVVFGEHTLADGARLVASLRARDVAICLGGPTRGASVRAGAKLLDPAIELVAIHDAARPLVTRSLFHRVVSAARHHGAAVPGLPVTDTILCVDDSDFVSAAPARRRLRAVQTPQIARRDWLECALGTSDSMTDEGSLLHQAGFAVQVVEGDPENVKITHSQDVALAEALLDARKVGP